EEDWEYDCRVASKSGRLHYCDEFVSDTRFTSGSQLSAGGSTDREKLSNRVGARALIFKHALAAGITRQNPGRRDFSPGLFLLARQCGAAGLSEPARTAFELARQASGTERRGGLDFFLYGACARLVGWRAVGRMACRLDRLRS